MACCALPQWEILKNNNSDWCWSDLCFYKTDLQIFCKYCFFLSQRNYLSIIYEVRHTYSVLRLCYCACHHRWHPHFNSACLPFICPWTLISIPVLWQFHKSISLFKKQYRITNKMQQHGSVAIPRQWRHLMSADTICFFTFILLIYVIL